MKFHKLLLIGLISPLFLFSQELKWNSELNFFFDNNEFAKSPLAIDQTMAGVTLTQEIGWKFDDKHYIVGGVDAMRSLGADKLVNDIHLLAYYQLKDENTLLKVGSFHRHDLLDDYSDFFFQDSIKYYRHTMEGMYFRKGNENQFVKLWLDWTGLQSATERETFFIGASGYKKFGKLFFADFQSYMFHYSITRPNPRGLTVSDYLLGQLSGGVNYSNRSGINKLLVSVGLLSGYERDRVDMNNYGTPTGGVARVEFDYRGFGTENTLYYGQPRMVLYYRHANNLYWGNPFLRAESYMQNKVYWNFINNDHIKGQLAARAHFSDGKVYFEQMLTLSAHINNYHPKKVKREPTFWERVFPRSGRASDGIEM